MEWQGVLSLGAMTLALIGLLIFLMKKLGIAIQKDAPDSIFVKPRLTLTGTALLACLLAFFLICLVARKLRPASFLGDFVGTTDGMIIVVAVSIITFRLIAEFLKRIGFPFVKED